MKLTEALTEPTVVIDRSTLETYCQCPLKAKLDLEQPCQDHDLMFMAECGQAGHDLLNDYITELQARQVSSDEDLLRDLLRSVPAVFHNYIAWCVDHTASRLNIWWPGYIHHEWQYAYKLDSLGATLTCRPDLVEYGGEPGTIKLTDWKFGRGKEGFEFQAAYYSLVIARAMEGVERVTWQPFYCFFGVWGPKQEFGEKELNETEDMLRTEAERYLNDKDWRPLPGEIRCLRCPHREACPAERRYDDLVADPDGYLAGTVKLEAQVKARWEATKEYVKAGCPGGRRPELDGKSYGPQRSNTVTWKLGAKDPEDNDEA
jgi:hypothetical protein